TVALNSTCDYSPTHYMASENAGFAGASWSVYSTSPTFTLSAGAGTKTVYFKTKNEIGESSEISDTIVLE
ncbi:MAG TPA: hypothetical protein P5318_18005, partial [Candidatus Hydrogenedentes bacterium]|nr:hypothetical protein [Candidatus Hydrogenedentota bacterium]HRT66709.1 hypothetical protein [Candidatus Hydrogenedentota bacterium]